MWLRFENKNSNNNSKSNQIAEIAEIKKKNENMCMYVCISKHV